MKKQIFTIILLLMGGVSAFGQFILDGGAGNPIRLRTDGTTRMYIAPNSVTAPVLPGNVGIGTLAPPAKLTVVGDMALQKIQRETSSGGFNDYDRQDASIAIFENGGTIGGIQGGSKGQMLYVLCGYGINQSALVIKHESAGNPTAANRILTHTGADFTISAGAGGVLLIYDDAKARWRIVETPSGSGTAGWGLTGNSGTNPATQFIGTTDAQPLAFKTNNVEAMRVLSTGNVGIGTSTPDGKLDVFGDFILSKRTVIQTTGVQNAFDRQGASFLFFDSMGTITLNGITNGIQGMVVYLAGGINNTLIINNENVASSPNDRIYTNTGASLTISGRGGATLIYGSGGWRVIGFAD
jgi:hypothetical protein